MSNPIFSGPQAPERNPPINPQYYQPSNFKITAIALGSTTTVTTAVNQNYVIGQQVKFLIPFNYGTTQLNGQQGLVVNIPSANQVTVNINSSNYNAFSTPSQTFTYPQIIAIGDVNTGAINPNGPNMSTVIPGSFIDISPA